ncbi:hypothetical protein Dvina_29685 [Dactylosporangium vinaceum]|uniref:DUF6081 family protein n=1 Tax=Dactylosporangium vinaceum TaxID=53362 RepID=A0ABV5ME43_9ACTN|nr:DUF6081 family protein [Dactylosporangium vinaceum]UAB92515.1 hypothetical protein Dvina_29685 [Dactylosporangium vinaceum]
MPTEPYDNLTGPQLDASLWAPLDMGGPRVEPGAVTTVAGGAVTVDVAAFTNADPHDQSLDNTKHVMFSTRTFALPPSGPARFEAELAVDHIGGGSGDYRLGIAAFIVVEPSTGKVFNILATADRLFAEHEELPYPGVAAPFTRVVDDPLAGVGGPGFHAVAVELDRSRGHVAWTAGGRLLHEASGLSDLPAAVTIGFGLFTLLPIGGGRSSAQGQGARASWRHFRYHA